MCFGASNFSLACLLIPGTAAFESSVLGLTRVISRETFTCEVSGKPPRCGDSKSSIDVLYIWISRRLNSFCEKIDLFFYIMPLHGSRLINQPDDGRFKFIRTK